MEQPREVHDEEHERVWERVAAVDVAKGSGVVCTRVPDEDRPGRRKTHVHTVPARSGAVTELGDYLRARSILVIIYHLLATPEARYRDLGPGWYENKINNSRAARSHIRQLEALGYQVTITKAA